MKKSCFIQAVIVITIVVAAAVYIIQYKLDDWFIKPTKDFLVSEIIKNWDDETKHINDSVHKDSLKALIIYYIDNIKSVKEVVNLDEEKFLTEIKIVIQDSIITEEDISKLTLLLKKEQNEKSESNRN
ncbi:MAG: hypothetical protein U5J96_06215 [Ignavibacteriaceae bacterium]|nr:hypothetical protein [Ignavibacteriaceae bacterium]